MTGALARLAAIARGVGAPMTGRAASAIRPRAASRFEASTEPDHPDGMQTASSRRADDDAPPYRTSNAPPNPPPESRHEIGIGSAHVQRARAAADAPILEPTPGSVPAEERPTPAAARLQRSADRPLPREVLAPLVDALGVAPAALAATARIEAGDAPGRAPPPASGPMPSGATSPPPLPLQPPRTDAVASRPSAPRPTPDRDGALGPAQRATHAPAPDIVVRIGRIDVTAPTPPRSRASVTPRDSRLADLDLGAYLRGEDTAP